MLLLKKNQFLIPLFGLLLTSQLLISQTTNKGKFFAFWGWNRGSYSTSDIHFKGTNYAFTLHKVNAKDKITPFTFYDYFNPSRITIPQTNFKIGYFFSEHYTVSFGIDHMKYVMTPYQTVKIDGTINVGSAYDKTYVNEPIVLKHDFLQFEHTDGLNYLNIELKRFDDISHFLNIQSSNFQINLTEGIGGGILLPKTNATLLNKKRHDDFHLSGYGISMSAGLNLTFFNHFFIQSDFKYGYINMPDIRTTESSTDKASQHFTFFERTIVFGGRFRLF